MKPNFKQKLMAGLLSVCMVFQTAGIVPVYAAENVTDSDLPIGTSSVCTHHVHDDKCGYTEGTPCTHVHKVNGTAGDREDPLGDKVNGTAGDREDPLGDTEECSAEVTKCVHEHTAECYSGELICGLTEEVVDSGSSSDAAHTHTQDCYKLVCTHQCSVESGCITKELACKHEHNAECGYTEGTPCTFDTATCESCNPKNTADNIVTLAGAEVYAVYDTGTFHAATQAAPSTATEAVISDKNTIHHLYIMGESAPEELMLQSTILTSVTMPNVTTIGTRAFQGCKNLTNVAMPSVITIGFQAFDGCAGLASVEMSSATKIDGFAFSSCTSLASVAMPKVTTIGNNAFLGCTSLTSAQLPKVITIVNNAFTDCINLASVEMPSATSIGNMAFSNCQKLASLTLGATPPATVGTGAFTGCPASRNLTIQGSPDSLAGAVVKYKAVNDGNIEDELWYGWTLPSITPSAGTLEITGNVAPTYGTINTITLTATFDKATNIGKKRASTINQVEFKDGTTVLGNGTATQNDKGKWVAALNVKTKDWAVGAHNLTATFAGNEELVGSTTKEVTVTVNESYAVYDGGKFCRATKENPSTATSEEITDKKTINHLYIMGESVPRDLMNSCTVLTSVKAPSTTKIDTYAFSDCTQLASLTLGATPPTVGADAFKNCLTPRTLIIQGTPDSQADAVAKYKAVNDGATDDLWYGWTLPTTTRSAGTLAVATGNAAPTFGAENAITLTATFDKAAKVGKQRALTINQVEFKDGTTALGTVTDAKNVDGKWVATLNVNTKDWALGAHNLTATFAGNKELVGSTTTEVTVTVNESYAVYDGGSKKFYAATADDHTKPTTTEITDKKAINHLYITGAIVPERLMYDWQNPYQNLKTVTCADTVTTIGKEAFYECTGLASVKLPKATSIGEQAFNGCTSLASVEMLSATTIGNDAFFGCTSLASVEMPDATTIGDRAFNGCIALTSAQLPKVTTIGLEAFSGCTALASVEMPEATSIYGGVFSDCTSLASVEMPKVTSIGNYAFYGCKALASVAMPKVTSIGEGALNNCTSLASVAMPDATDIGEGAFSGCTALASVAMPNATTISASAFNTCTSLESVQLPKVTTIDNYAFYGCKALTSAKLPSATTIGTQAFYNCTTLASLTLGATPPTVGGNAFTSCPKTNALTIQGNTAYQDTVLAAYNTAAGNDGTADEKWYGWALPTTLDGTGVSTSAGTLTAAGNTSANYKEENTITFTASFAKVGENKRRTLAENQISLLKDGVAVESKAATLTNGVYSAEFTVQTNAITAGNYNYTAKFDGNRSLVSGTATDAVTVTINKIDQAALNILNVPNKVTYGDSNFTLSTTGGSGNGAVTYTVSVGDAVSVVESTGVVTVLKAGTATITATKAADSNYNATTGTVEITVQSATPTLTWGNATQTATYTGSAAVITAPSVTLVNGDTFNGTISYTYEKKSFFSLFTAPENGLPVNAGTYTVTAHIAAEGNYTAADSATMELTIEKSTPTLVISTMNGKTYDGTAVANPTAGNMAITGASYTDVTFAYSKNGDMSSSTTNAPKDAGAYYVQASVKAGDNTNAASSNFVSFTITQAPLTVTGGTVTQRQYNGGTDAAVTALTFGGLANGETLALTTDYTVGAPAYDTANAGTDKTVTGTAALASNDKTGNYTLTGTYTITGQTISKATGLAAPTDGAMDDTMGKDTFTFTPVTGYEAATLYEYSMDDGTTWTDISANPISAGNVAGTIKIRIKSTTNYEAGAVYTHSAAFTATLEGSVSLNKTTGVTYGDTITATVTDTQDGAALKYQWKAGNVAISGTSNTLQVPGSAVGKTITVEVTATGYNGNLTSSATNAVAKKAVTATAGTVSKVYDGTDTATVSLSIGKVNTGDDITITAAKAVYTDAGVNTNKTITLGALRISGAAAGWYDVTAPTTVTGEITAKVLTDATVTVGGTYTYTGSAITPAAENVTVKDGATTLTNGTDYSYAASNNKSAGTATLTVTLKGNYSGTASKTFIIAKADPTYSIPTNLTATYGQTLSAVTLTTGFSWMDGTKSVGGVGAQTHKAKFTPADTANVNTIENLNVTVTVGKADAFALNSSAIMVKKQANYTVKLDMTKVSGYPAILGGTPAFAVTGNTSNGLTGATMDADGKTLVLVANNTTNSAADTVTVSVTGMGNYNDSTITVAVSYTDKTPVTITGVTTQDGTYHGGTQKGYIGTPTSAFIGSYDVTYTGRDGTTYNSSNAPKIAGDYTVTISIPESNANYMGSISLNFTVSKATVTIKADNKSAYVGDTQPALTYTATGLATGESLQTVPTLTCTPDMSKAGSYEIIVSGAVAPNTDNYNSDITYTAGTLTVSTRPSSGGGDSNSGSSGGNSGSGSGGSVVIIPSTPTEKDPTPPTKSEIKAPATVDNNGNASITVTDKTVADAIEKAQEEAKKNGTEKNGVAVELNVDTGKKTPDSISAKLPKAVQDSLVEGKVSEFKIVSEAANLTFDSKTLQEIQKQAGGDAVIHASKADVSKLSNEAQKEIGDRPVFNLSITGKDGKTISDFDGGSATVSIPYTLQPGENPDNLQAYFIDAKGELHEVPSTYDPVTKCMVFVTNHFSTYGIGYKENALKFNDIAKHWAKNDIEFVTARGLLSGTDKATFSPNTAMTRGMFVTALGRLAGADVSGYQKSSFADMKSTDYFMGYVEWASKNGIVKGTSTTTFAPNAAISRQEMAAIMANYAKTMHYTLPKTRTAVTFTDHANIASWASEAVKSMQMAGVIMGKDGNRFDPTATATRAEASAVLRRYVELVIDKATAQGLDVNDSGKIVYYENGKLFTGTKTIDGTTYHFGNDGICVKIDAVIPDTKKYVIHKIVRGDTLWDIAMKNKCTVAEIVGLNGIKDPNNVPIGTELKIPQK